MVLACDQGYGIKYFAIDFFLGWKPLKGVPLALNFDTMKVSVDNGNVYSCITLGESKLIDNNSVWIVLKNRQMRSVKCPTNIDVPQFQPPSRNRRI